MKHGFSRIQDLVMAVCGTHAVANYKQPTALIAAIDAALGGEIRNIARCVASVSGGRESAAWTIHGISDDGRLFTASGIADEHGDVEEPRVLVTPPGDLEAYEVTDARIVDAKDHLKSQLTWRFTFAHRDDLILTTVGITYEPDRMSVENLALDLINSLSA